MAATAGLGFRLTPQDRVRIERAAELTGEPVAAFARTAANERAGRVLREHESVTVVSESFFDDLVEAFDASPKANPVLGEASARLRLVQKIADVDAALGR